MPCVGEALAELVVEAGRAEQAAQRAAAGDDHPVGGRVAVPQDGEQALPGVDLQVAEALADGDLLVAQDPEAGQHVGSDGAGAGRRPSGVRRVRAPPEPTRRRRRAGGAADASAMVSGARSVRAAWPSGLGKGLQSPLPGFDSRRRLRRSRL